MVSERKTKVGLEVDEYENVQRRQKKMVTKIIKIIIKKDITF